MTRCLHPERGGMPKPLIVVTQKSRLVIDWLRETTEIGEIKLRPKTTRKNLGYAGYTNGAAYRWRIWNTQDSESLLRMIEPYLILKKDRAKLALDLIKILKPRGARYTVQERERAEELRSQIQEFNRAGGKSR